MDDTEDRTIDPLWILSLDGSHLGSYEISQILLLKSIMYSSKPKNARVGQECDESGDGMISDSFDFIAGAGFGGVIAMLSTKISINKIIDFYVKLHEALFSKPEWKDRNMEANALAVHRLIEEFLPDIGLDEPILRTMRVHKDTCTFTCALNPENAAYPRLFTSYKPKYMSAPCTLRQAIELSLADEEHLPPFKLGNPHANERFVGAAHRFSNPMPSALKEVESLFGSSQRVNCIVSIGAGTDGVIATDASKKMIADGEREAGEWQGRCSKVDGLFLRLNVDKGLKEGNDLGAIRSHTEAYLAEPNSTTILDALAHRERSEWVEIGPLVFPVTDHDKTKLRMTQHRIPSRPLYFYGREREKDAITTPLIQRKSSIICGPGGVGKTSLAVVVLHDTQLESDPRYFFDCRDVQTLNSLCDEIADALGIKRKLGKIVSTEDLWTAICNELEDMGGVVCLDNLETLWDQDELREEIETILASLDSLKTISLLVTMRAAKPPGQVKWATRISLLPLYRHDAFRLFQALSQCTDDDEYAWKLLDCTDFLPLAVELLGYLADGVIETTQDVWERWENKGTSIATRGNGPRLDLNSSIELSLDSPQLKKFPTARSTLYLLSLLPAGVDTKSTFFAPLQRGIGDVLDNLHGLSHLSLVVIDNTTTRRFRLLAPIARYAADNLSSSFPSHHRTSLIQSSISFINLYGPYTPANHLFVPSELSNMLSVLAYASAEYMSDKLAEGILGYAKWAYYIGLLGDNLLHRIYNSKHTSIPGPLLAMAFLLQGNISMDQDCLDKAEDSLTKAIPLFKETQDILGEGNSWKSFGQLYMRQNRLDDAEKSLSKAITQFEGAHDTLGEGNSRHTLGQLYMRQDRLDKAEESLNKSIPLFEQAHDDLGEGNLRRSLGDLYMRQDRLDEAETSLKRAIELFQQVHDVVGEGNSHVSLGNLYMRQDRLREAEESLDVAMSLFQQAHDVPGEGNSRKLLGDLYMRLSRLDEAEESLNKAITHSQQAHDVLGEGNSRLSLGTLYMRQGSFNEAEKSLKNAIPLFEQASNVLGRGTSQKLLGQLYMRQNRLDEAAGSLREAISFFEQAQDVLGVGNSRQSLGQLYMRQDRLDEAEESLKIAILLFQQSHNILGEGNSQQSLGQLYLRRACLHEGETSLNKAITLFREASNVLGEGNVRTLLGQLYMRQDRLNEAEEAFQKSTELFQNVHDVLGEGNSRRSLGDLYLRKDRLYEAEESLNNAIPLFQQVQNVLGEGNTWRSLGTLYIRQNRLKEAEASLNTAIGHFETAHNALGEGNSRHTLGQLYLRRGRLIDAEESLLKAIPLFQQAHNDLGAGSSLTALSQLYLRQNRLDEAEAPLKNAMSLFQQAHDILGAGNSRQSLGQLYMRQDRLDDAEKLLHESIVLFEQAHSGFGEGNSRKSLGDLYRRQNRLDEAETSLHIAISCFQQAHDVLGEGNSRKSLGHLFLLQNQLPKAREALDQSIRCYKQCQSPYSEAYSHQLLGKVYEEMYDLEAAEAQYLTAIDLHRQGSDESGAQKTTAILEELRTSRRSDIQTSAGGT